VNPRATQAIYGKLQKGFHHFNKALFDSALPDCAITFRRGRSRGYYAADRCEIALNPEHMTDGVMELFSWLLRGMVHLWQQHYGKPGRPGYHNKQWAEMMRELGLIPKGDESGKPTGDKVGHCIEPGGRFAHTVETLLVGGLEFTWSEVPAHRSTACGGNETGEGASGATRSGKRVRYACGYGHLAWARPGANLVCGEHRVRMEPAD
jgi:hypothetical protein